MKSVPMRSIRTIQNLGFQFSHAHIGEAMVVYSRDSERLTVMFMMPPGQQLQSVPWENIIKVEEPYMKMCFAYEANDTTGRNILIAAGVRRNGNDIWTSI